MPYGGSCSKRIRCCVSDEQERENTQEFSSNQVSSGSSQDHGINHGGAEPGKSIPNETFHIVVVTMTGDSREVLGLRPRDLLSSLCSKITIDYGTSGKMGKVRLALGTHVFGAHEMGQTLSELGLSQGSELTCILQTVIVLSAQRVPYPLIRCGVYGLMFEVSVRAQSLQLVALETCARDVVSHATVYVRTGSLMEGVGDVESWVEVGTGSLHPKSASRIEISRPTLLQSSASHVIYIATNQLGGLAYSGGGTICPSTTASNDDLQVTSGHPLFSSTHFAELGVPRRHFNGRLEYLVVS